MYHKRSVYYFLLIAISLTLLLPVFNLSFTYKYKTIYSKSFSKEQLFTTDNIESFRNYLLYKSFNISMNEPKVIAGKARYLFLGNKYGKIIDKVEGKFSYTEKDIDQWTDRLKDLQTWYEDNNIKFIIVIAPNKHSVYKDRLPDWIKTKSRTLTDDIVDHSKKRQINILDLRAILIDNKDKRPLYMKTDTHWNNVGAAIAYEATIDHINHIYNIQLKKPLYMLQDKYKGPGDLAYFLKINRFLPSDYDNVFTYDFKKELYVCHGEIDKGTGNLKKCKKALDPVMFINHDAQYMNNNKALNTKRLLFLCDSFAGSGGGKVTHAPLYNRTFRKIWKWHFTQLRGERLADFVTKYKPDLVIYQIVERDLYQDTILTQLPTIIQENLQENNILGKKIFDVSEDKFYKNNHFTLSDNNLHVYNTDPVIILNDLNTTSESVNIKIKISSPKKTTFKIYYKKHLKDHYSESRTYFIGINKGSNNIDLIVPGRYINNGLRIDLVNTKGRYIVGDFSIYEVP